MPGDGGRQRFGAMIFAVLATGPSLTQEIVDSVRGRAKVVVVSDAYRLAPWADALVSQDGAWWRANPEAKEFQGRRFSGTEVRDVETVEGIPSGSNSGLLALKIAVQLGATKVLLCGIDLAGTHYFGEHKPPLKNTTSRRFEVFQDQFARYKPRGVKILNCSPASMLRAYPKADLYESLP